MRNRTEQVNGRRPSGEAALARLRVGPVFAFIMRTAEKTALVAPLLLVCSVSQSPMTLRIGPVTMGNLAQTAGSSGTAILTCGNTAVVGMPYASMYAHRYPDSRGPLAQWQSCGLLIHRFGVRVPGGLP